MTKKQIKEIFKKNDVQLSQGTMDSIIYELKFHTTLMAIRCKKGNVKRLTPDLMYVAIGKLKHG